MYFNELSFRFSATLSLDCWNISRHKFMPKEYVKFCSKLPPSLNAKITSNVFRVQKWQYHIWLDEVLIVYIILFFLWIFCRIRSALHAKYVVTTNCIEYSISEGSFFKSNKNHYIQCSLCRTCTSERVQIKLAFFTTNLCCMLINCMPCQRTILHLLRTRRPKVSTRTADYDTPNSEETKSVTLGGSSVDWQRTKSQDTNMGFTLLRAEQNISQHLSYHI